MRSQCDWCLTVSWRYAQLGWAYLPGTWLFAPSLATLTRREHFGPPLFLLLLRLFWHHQLPSLPRATCSLLRLLKLGKPWLQTTWDGLARPRPRICVPHMPKVLPGLALVDLNIRWAGPVVGSLVLQQNQTSQSWVKQS